MSQKKRRSVSLDADVYEYLSKHYNGSALVNDLLTEYMSTEDKQKASLDLQISQKERELSEAQKTVTRLQSDIEELEDLRNTIQSSEHTKFEKAYEVLKGEDLDETHAPVKFWADRIGITPAELIQRIDQHSTQ